MQQTSPLKKIAITGSNGSVGRRTVFMVLKHGYCVVGIDQSPLVTADDRELGSNFSLLQTDLKDYDGTLKASDLLGSLFRALEGCEAIIHLAACPKPGDYKVVVHNSNVVISWNVLRAAAEVNAFQWLVNTLIVPTSSINTIPMIFSQAPRFEFFPIDESHPCLPDEPYGLSKVYISIVRRFPDMRVASLRLHWSVPSRAVAQKPELVRAKNQLWGYVQEDSAAEAFILAVTQPADNWSSAAEPFFIAAPETTFDGNTSELLQEYWPNVPIKHGKEMGGNIGCFDCSKAKALLGWVHNPDLTSSIVYYSC
ncbi:hypothetical protein B0H17DRAFT_954448 [Mycena rosella]|uniref:NAD-dependent epimerase/dehydratase domain-containing protein n=1 Tax=Mycena rosella TaxID=1033263 RepID=A0AAD7CRS5_MYCRO|nr:hypothetical protein B0H17DRAFT_954448 [Mycena rosella]